jgi:hypothetical protein
MCLTGVAVLGACSEPEDPAFWSVVLELPALTPTATTFVCETGPSLPGLLIRIEITMLLGCDCVPSPVAAAPCPVAACWAPSAPLEPACEVALSFVAPTVTTATFVCEIGPFAPGLLIRTDTTRFVGAVCVATPFAIACCSVPAAWPSSARAVPAAASGYKAQSAIARQRRRVRLAIFTRETGSIS